MQADEVLHTEVLWDAALVGLSYLHVSKPVRLGRSQSMPAWVTLSILQPCDQTGVLSEKHAV